MGCSEEKAREVSSYLAPLVAYFKSKKEELDLPKLIDKGLYEKINSCEGLQGRDELLKVINNLLEYDRENKGFVILPAKNNFFARIDAENLYICFDSFNNEFNNYNHFIRNEDIKSRTYEFFYLYSDKKMQPKDFLEYLFNIAHNEIGVRV